MSSRGAGPCGCICHEPNETSVELPLAEVYEGEGHEKLMGLVCMKCGCSHPWRPKR